MGLCGDFVIVRGDCGKVRADSLEGYIDHVQVCGKCVEVSGNYVKMRGDCMEVCGTVWKCVEIV